MFTLRKYLTPCLSALILGVVPATLASGAFARVGEYPISTAREAAIRGCSRAAGKFPSTRLTWQLHAYRSCMSEHGEPE
jgi:hypothetical protein